MQSAQSLKLIRLSRVASFFSVLLAALVLAGCGGEGDSTNVTNTTTVSPVAVSTVFPDEARVGETISVYGQNFGASQGSSTLRINDVVATQITGWSDNLIVATVPAGAITGNVTVTVNGIYGAPGYLVVPWQAENPDNVAVSTATGEQTHPRIVADGAGGAIVVWQDARNGNADIYAQRINNTGAVQWAGDDVAICTATRDQEVPQVIADGANGAIVVWQDLRHAPLLDLFPYHVYSQRVNSIGAVQWYTNGIPISMAENDQLDPQIVDDGTGGAIMAWWDYRSQNADIYAQGITRGGRQ